ncbi:hypothetical protein LCGC14_0953880 [marine sediment metagenome]|uniref:2TM domain-containing protein n=1 Tax=marine sediment metagenome TaxID=412755 RepID=A0A0F9RMW5_9ZZZZ
MKKQKELKKIRKEIKERWIGYSLFFVLGMLYGWFHYWVEAIVVWTIVFLLIRFSDEYTGRYRK